MVKTTCNNSGHFENCQCDECQEAKKGDSTVGCIIMSVLFILIISLFIYLRANDPDLINASLKEQIRVLKVKQENEVLKKQADKYSLEYMGR